MLTDFFQSELFEELQKKIPYRGKAWLVKGEKAHALAIKMKLPFNFSWLWIPYGPVGYDAELFKKLKHIAEKERALFARVEPGETWEDSYTKMLRKEYFVKNSPERFTAEHTLVLDLQKDERELLAQMKPKGRYNINVARKNGVEVQIFSSYEKIPPQDFDAFYNLINETAKRDGFRGHPKIYYELLLKIPKNSAQLVLAYKDEEVIAGAIIIFYKDNATYYYGASSYEQRKCMAPYLVQWEAILEAKKQGMKNYDFLGIAPDDNPNHAWAGITDFKKKFGGREVGYPQAVDITYKPLLYKVLWLWKKIRR